MLKSTYFGPSLLLPVMLFFLNSLPLAQCDEIALQNAIETARSRTQLLLSEAGIPGLSVAVGTGTDIVWSEGFGFADLDAKTPATPQTIYRIGSVSKLLTVAALAAITEKGQVDLDAPIRTYLPNGPNHFGQINARQLAGHSGGIRHYNGAQEVITQSQCDTVAAAVATFGDDPLLHDPGSRYAYSSYGYVLLSHVIEKARGKPFLETVDEMVLAPLGLSSTRPEDTGIIDPATSAFYVFWRGEVMPSPPMNVSCRWAAGGFHSTAEDLTRFMLAHVNGGWLKPQTVELLFTPQRLNDQTPTKVGLGWRVATDPSGRRFVHHGGDITGGRSFVLMYPDQKLAIAICCNLGRARFAEKEALEVIAPFLAAARP
jgi:serine beta-lactamase-like protein LACTB, mitochondrial